ncbi:MAG: hypothetical protein WA210_04625 [Burkholderiaceae bacterium]
MTRFVEVRHTEWIDAPRDAVRSQFADLPHHIANNVHPKLRFEILTQDERRARFVQEVRLLGLRQRDVFERVIADDGSMHDESVEGFNKGGSLDFAFAAERGGTRVDICIRLPTPGPLALLRPLLAVQVRRELRAAAAEDKYDIEVRGYPAPSLLMQQP